MHLLRSKQRAGEEKEGQRRLSEEEGSTNTLKRQRTSTNLHCLNISIWNYHPQCILGEESEKCDTLLYLHQLSVVISDYRLYGHASSRRAWDDVYQVSECSHCTPAYMVGVEPCSLPCLWVIPCWGYIFSPCHQRCRPTLLKPGEKRNYYKSTGLSLVPFHIKQLKFSKKNKLSLLVQNLVINSHSSKSSNNVCMIFYLAFQVWFIFDHGVRNHCRHYSFLVCLHGIFPHFVICENVSLHFYKNMI